MSHRSLPWLALAALLPPAIVVAADYLTIEEAQKAIFPDGDAFQEIVIAQQTPAQLEAMLAQAGAQPPHGTIRIWRATHNGTLLGHVFVDEVIGKAELISYAVGIGADGKLRHLEILAYRESHGSEVRNPGWRTQFEGLSSLDQLRFRTDIKNISGATLSSEHVTEGVRWLMALWQATLRTA